MASGILKSKVSVYEFSLDDMKEFIAADLDVDVEDIRVEYVIQEVQGNSLKPGTFDEVTGIRVTLNHDVTD